MNRSDWNDFSNALVDEAAHDVAALEAGMGDAAAMVLVGDVYAALVCQDVVPVSEARVLPAVPADGDELTPFIR